MLFYCSKCGKTVFRDGRFKPYRNRIWFKSWCDKTNQFSRLTLKGK